MRSETALMLSRRGVLKAGAGAAFGAAFAPVLAACGSNEEQITGGPVTGTIEAWVSDPRPPATRAAEVWARAFESEHADVEVDIRTVPYGDDSTRLRARSAGGVVPELAWAYGDNVTAYGTEGLVSDVSGIIDEIGRDRFLPQALEGIELDDGIFTVPVVGFPQLVYYRKDLYERAGLDIPTSHEELLENIEALHDPPGTYGYMLFNGQTYEPFHLKAVMWTHAAYYFDENDELALDRPETVEAWEYYKALGQFTPPGSMAQSDLESRELIKDGKVAHAISTTSLAGDISDADIGQFGAFVLPRKESGKGMVLDFVGQSIPTKATNIAGAEAMIEFLFEPDTFQTYLGEEIVGWLPMLEGAYTDEFYARPANQKRREFIEAGLESAREGIVGLGYFGPTAHTPIMVSTGVEKAIGDRLVVDDQSVEQVIDFAIGEIESEL